MKKLAKLTLMLLIVIYIICTMGNVYAQLNCNLEIETSEITFYKNDEFSVDINLSNIQTEQGVISLGATLEYDNESLEIVKIEGKNGWETPTDGTSYNSKNGKIAITRSGFCKDDETVFTITFKVKEESKKNLIIILRNITVADGTKPVKIQIEYKNITIIDGIENEMPTLELETNAQTTTNTVEEKSVEKKNTAKTIIVIICIIIIVVIILNIIKNIMLKRKRKRKHKNKGKKIRK